MVIKNRIREARLLYSMTQAELAKKIGVSKNAICSYELGEYYPSLPVVIKLCIVFDCMVEWLFYLGCPLAESIEEVTDGI